jgi:hypothetical protein
MRKQFSTSGHCEPERHYMIPAAERMPDVMRLVTEGRYFAIHAPAMTGKTTLLTELAGRINGEGASLAVLCSLKQADGVFSRDEALDVAARSFSDSLRQSGVPEIPRVGDRTKGFRGSGSGTGIGALARLACESLDRDLVLFFDDVDSLSDSAMTSFLGQLENLRLAGKGRASGFPVSVVLAGRSRVPGSGVQGDWDRGARGTRMGSGVFSPTRELPDFTQEQIRQLYLRHTDATGQHFSDGAAERAWHWSGGRPWIVSELAAYAIGRRQTFGAGGRVGGKDIDLAAKRLVTGGSERSKMLLDFVVRPGIFMAVNFAMSQVVHYVMPEGEEFPPEVPPTSIARCAQYGLIGEHADGRPACRMASPFCRELARVALAGLKPAGIRLAARPDGHEIPGGTAGPDGTDGSGGKGGPDGPGTSGIPGTEDRDMSVILRRFQSYYQRCWLERLGDGSLYPRHFNEVASLIESMDLAGDNDGDDDDGDGDDGKPGAAGIAERLKGMSPRVLTVFGCLKELSEYLRSETGEMAEIALPKLCRDGRSLDITVGLGKRVYPMEVTVRRGEDNSRAVSQITEHMRRCLVREGWILSFYPGVDCLPWERSSWETIVLDGNTIHIVGC